MAVLEKLKENHDLLFEGNDKAQLSALLEMPQQADIQGNRAVVRKRAEDKEENAEGEQQDNMASERSDRMVCRCC